MPNKSKDESVRGVNIGQYQLIKTLGEGSFAKVRLAVHRLTRQQVAIKCIDKTHLPDAYSVKNMYREAQIMKLLDHPNIIRLYEVIETKNEINLVLSYASGGEVLDYTVAHGKLKEAEAKKMVSQIVDAMIYCHSVGVVHRDLKAENLLLDEDLNIQITDFGLSNVFDASKKLKTFCGSPVYSAPELIEGIQYVGPEVDVWSLGVIVFAMVVGELPFADRNIRLLQQSIVEAKYKIPPFVSDNCVDLIKSMLVVNRKARFTMKQIKEHIWLTSSLYLQAQRERPIRHHPLNESEIDQITLTTLTEMGFDQQTCIDSILSKKQDQMAATYNLLMDHRLKSELKKRQSSLTNANTSQSLSLISTGELPISIVYAEVLPIVSVENVESSVKDINLQIGIVMQTPLLEVETAEVLAPKIHQTVPEAVQARVARRARAHTVGPSQQPNLIASITADTPLVEKSRYVSPSAAPNAAREGGLSVKTNAKPTNATRKASPLSAPPVYGSDMLKVKAGSTESPSSKPVGMLNSAIQRIMAGDRTASRNRSQSLSTSRDAIKVIFTNVHPPQGSQFLKVSHITDSTQPSRNGSTDSSMNGSTGSNMSNASNASGSSGSAEVREIRTVRFAFNMMTTSSLSPEEMKGKLQNALKLEDIKFTQDSFVFFCTWSKFDASGEFDKDSIIKFEAEICKIPRLALHGIRLKRQSGDIWEYKRVCTKFMKQWEAQFKV